MMSMASNVVMPIFSMCTKTWSPSPLGAYAGISSTGVGTHKSFLKREAFEAAWAERGR